MAIFTKSENFKSEYACEVVQIGRVIPIEGSDFLGKVEIHPGMPIVVRKDEVKEGDVMFYVDMECQLNHQFLEVNNQFEDSALNKDISKKGYINKYGRIRMVRLRGQESMGYLFSQESMEEYFISKNWNLCYVIDQHLGETFDTVNGELFVKAYIPPTNNQKIHNQSNKHDKKIKCFDRMIPGEFSFHYDTDQFEKNIHRFTPEDVVDISVKLHGTSAIFAHVRTRRPLTIWEKIKQFFGINVNNIVWDNIYSSRTVIKNQYINQKVSPGYYGEDIWGYWNNLIKEYIPKGMTIYAEIIGYTPTGSYIQKGYDYGCKPNESKLMIYRINSECNGSTHEWNIQEIKEWTEKLIKNLKENNKFEISEQIHPIDILWHGKLTDLFPELCINEDWQQNVIHALHNKKDWFMEMNEPLCKNKVPREGIVIRKYNDPLKEAFKLKTFKYKGVEAKLIDSGEIDIEMKQNYEVSE